MKGPLAVIGTGLAAIVCCVAGPAAIIAAIAAIGLTGATGGLTAALLAAAAAVIVILAGGARRRRARPVADTSTLESAAQSPATPEMARTACSRDC